MQQLQSGMLLPTGPIKENQMIDNKKTVFTNGEYRIVRNQYYGFRCNTLSSDWDVLYRGQFICHFFRLKNAKKFVQTLLKGATP